MDLNKLFSGDNKAKEWRPTPVLSPFLDAGVKKFNSDRKETSPTMFRCSGIGGCDRKAVLKLLGHKEEMTVQGMIRVNMGTVIHELFQKYLENDLESLEERVYFNELLSGSYDGILAKKIAPKTMLEIKTMNVEAYQRMLLYPVIYPKYKYQANSYMHSLDLDEVIFIFVNLNCGFTEQFKKENLGKLDNYNPVYIEVKYKKDPAYVELINERISVRKGHYEEGTVPPYKKVSECDYCGVKEICKNIHQEEKDEIKRVRKMQKEKNN